MVVQAAVARSAPRDALPSEVALIAASEGPKKYGLANPSGTRATAKFVRYCSYTIDNMSKFRSKR